jgi:hypothetical protein
MNREYLPSKIFMIRVAVIIGIIVIIFGTSKLINYFKNKPKSNAPTKVVFKDALEAKDSNNNGIPDWEEFLWGLNPEKDGESNKEFIMQKKQTLALDNTGTEEGSDAKKENETLSREFFSVIMTLMQSGNLSEESISEVTNAIGKKVEITPIPDIYKRDMLTIDNSATAQTKYLESFSKLLDKYSDADIGSELVIIAQGLAGNDPQALKAAGTISISYRNFGQELMKIATPEKLASDHINLANDFEKTAQSLDGLTQMLDNQLTGMKAILNYKKYSTAIGVDLDNLYSNLE